MSSKLTGPRGASTLRVSIFAMKASGPGQAPLVCFITKSIIIAVV